jgi:hypothetical protein
LGAPASGVTVRDEADNFVGTDGESVFAEIGVEFPPMWKRPVRVATTANGTLVTAFEAGDTIDSVVLAEGDRILLKNQTAGAENGIYTVNASGAPTRATDMDADAEVRGAVVYVIAGTANGGKAFRNTNTAVPTLGTTALTFAEFGAGVTDHGALTGLADDDHPQYATNTEFDDHNTRHETGGADAIKLDDLAAPDDNTDLNATTTKHGLLPKLGGGSANFLRADGTWNTPPGTGGAAGALLAITIYRPGSSTFKSTTSTTSVDVDATNLAVTFTAPASGIVIARWSALAKGPTTVSYYWQVRDGSTVKDWQRVCDNGTDRRFYSVPFYVSGLTPTTSYTFKWGHAVDSGTGELAFGPGTTNIGPGIMEIWEV